MRETATPLLLVPRVNSNDDTVEVLQWYVEDGSYVEKGKDLIELGTSKATVVLAAESTGYIRIYSKKGTFPAVGAILAGFYPTAEAAKTAPEIASISAGSAGSTPSIGSTGPTRSLAPVSVCQNVNRRTKIL